MGFTLFEPCSHEPHMISVNNFYLSCWMVALYLMFHGLAVLSVPCLADSVCLCASQCPFSDRRGISGFWSPSRPIPNAAPIRGISGSYGGSGSSILRRKQKRSNGPGETCCQEAHHRPGPGDLPRERRLRVMRGLGQGISMR